MPTVAQAADTNPTTTTTSTTGTQSRPQERCSLGISKVASWGRGCLGRFWGVLFLTLVLSTFQLAEAVQSERKRFLPNRIGGRIRSIGRIRLLHSEMMAVFDSLLRLSPSPPSIPPCCKSVAVWARSQAQHCWCAALPAHGRPIVTRRARRRVRKGCPSEPPGNFPSRKTDYQSSKMGKSIRSTVILCTKPCRGRRCGPWPGATLTLAPGFAAAGWSMVQIVHKTNNRSAGGGRHRGVRSLSPTAAAQ